MLARERSPVIHAANPKRPTADVVAPEKAMTLLTLTAWFLSNIFPIAHNSRFFKKSDEYRFSASSAKDGDIANREYNIQCCFVATNSISLIYFEKTKIL